MTDTQIFSKLANDPDFRDLVIAFVADLPIRSGKILELIRGGSIDDAAELLHQLKGAAGIYGYQPIHLLAKEVESLLKNGDPILEEKAIELEQLCLRASAEPN
jgi:HPt (histidine-containing phosphotransfer) domain-containing protein